MKKTASAGVVPLVIAILLLAAAGARAEHVFLKDGRILSGNIAGETDAAITLTLKDGSRKVIARKDVLRMLYSDEYMTKLVIRLTNGEEFEGFIVNETREDYTIRKKLYDTDEQTISKERVTYTAKKRPSELTARPSGTEIELTWSKPLGSFKKFIVYVKKKGEEYRQADETRRTTATVKGLDPNTVYYCVVRVLDDANYESPPSNEVMVKTLKAGQKAAELTEKEKEKEIAKEKEAEPVKRKAAPAGSGGTNVGISVRPSFILPFGDFKESADYGVGGIAGVDWLHVGGSGFRMGVHGGAWYMFPKAGTSEHIIAPVTLRLGYEFAPSPQFLIAPALDAGYAYSAMTYEYSSPLTALLIGLPLKSKKSVTGFSPIGMAGLQFLYLATDLVGIGLNAQYGMIFESSGLLHMLSLSAELMFRF